MKLLFSLIVIAQLFSQKLDSEKIKISQLLLDAGKKANINLLYEPNILLEDSTIFDLEKLNLDDVLDAIDSQIGIDWTWKDKTSLYVKIKQEFHVQLRSDLNFKGIYNAAIYKLNDELISTSNEAGYFILKRSELNKSYRFSHTNFIDKVTHIGIQNRTITLEERRYYSEPVQISSTEQPVSLSRKSVYRTEVHKEAIEALNIAGDFNEKISFFSGISSIKQKNSGLSIQASPDKQHQMYFDRMTIYQQSHLFGYISSINDEIIDKVSLYKGSYPARFGGRLSGIIDIESKKSNFSLNESVFNIDFLKTDLQTQFSPSENLTVLVAFRRSMIDLYPSVFTDEVLSFVHRQQYYVDGKKVDSKKSESKLPHVLFYDLSAKIGFTPNQNNYLSLSLFKSVDEFESVNQFSLDRPNINPNLAQRFKNKNIESRHWTNDGVSLLWLNDISEKWSANYQFSYSNFYNLTEQSKTFSPLLDDRLEEFGNLLLNRLENKNTIQEYSFKASGNHRFDQNKNLEFGYEFKEVSNLVKNHYLDSINYEFSNEGESIQNALFIQQELRYDSLLLNAGLRAVSYSQSEELYIEPRFSISYKFSPLRVTLNYSEQNQYLKHIYTHSFERANLQSFWLLAKDDFPVEHAKNTSITFSRTAEKSESEFELFYNQVDGQTFTFDIYDRRLDLNRSNSNGLRQGFSISHAEMIKAYTFNLRYQYSRATYRLDELEDSPTFFMNNDQRHQFFANLSYTYKAMDFQISGIYKSGAPFTNIDLTIPRSDEEILAQISNDRLPSLTLYNFSMRYKGLIGQNKFSVGLKIENLFNTKNIWTSYYDRRKDENDRDVFDRVDVEMIGFLPSLFFKIEF